MKERKPRKPFKHHETYTLHDAKVPYTAVSIRLLELSTKSAIVTAIQIYRTKSTDTISTHTSKFLTRHQRRELSETRFELMHVGLVTPTLDFIEPYIEERVLIPSSLNYAKFTFAEIKVLLACYREARCNGRRRAFRFEMTQEQLASVAQLSKRSLIRALQVLSDLDGGKYLVKITKNWQQSSEFVMLDPDPGWFGWPLMDVIRYYKNRRDELSPHAIYEDILHRKGCDVKGSVPTVPTDNVRGVLCPFCRTSHWKQKPSFYFSSKTKDAWGCARCKRSGDSKSLAARLGTFLDDEEGLDILNELFPPETDGTDYTIPDSVFAEPPDIDMSGIEDVPF